MSLLFFLVCALCGVSSLRPDASGQLGSTTSRAPHAATSNPSSVRTASLAMTSAPTFRSASLVPVEDARPLGASGAGAQGGALEDDPSDDGDDAAEALGGAAPIDEPSVDAPASSDQADAAGPSVEAETSSIEATLKGQDGSRYLVSVSYGRAARIPDGAELRLVELNRTLTAEEARDAANKDRPAATERFVSEGDLAKRCELLDLGLELEEGDWRYYQKFLDVAIVDAYGRTVDPADEVEVTIEASRIPGTQAGTVELAWRRAADEPTAELPYAFEAIDVEDVTDAEAAKYAKTRFFASSFGELAIAGVARQLAEVDIDGTTVAVLGSRGFDEFALVDTDAAVHDTYEQLLEAYQADVVPSPERGTTLWLSVVAAMTSPDQTGHLVGYRVRHGELAEAMFADSGTSVPVPFRADREGFALVWDSGMRMQSLEAGNVYVEGLLPERVALEARGMRKQYKDAATAAEHLVEAWHGEGVEPIVVAAYDITLTAGGQDVQPGEDEPVVVRIQSTRIVEGERYEIWHLLDDGSVEVLRDFDVVGDTVRFEATGFSVYLVVQTTPGTFVEYDTLADALAVAEDGDLLQLTEDVTDSIRTDRTLTLDLDGHTLTIEDGGAIQATGGTLTLRNGTVAMSDTLPVEIDGGTVVLADDLVVSAPQIGLAGTDGVLVVDGAMVSAGLTVGSGTTLTLEDGTIDGDIAVADGATLLVNGGEVTGAIDAEDGATVTISGGTFGQPIAPAWIADGAQDDVTQLVTVTANSASKVYDGTALTDDGYTVAGLPDGYELAGVAFEVVGSQTEVGERANVVSATGMMQVRDDQGADVTERYRLNLVNGTLVVSKRPVEVSVTGHRDTAVYDGTEHTVGGYDLAIDDALLTEEHISYAGTASASRTDAGTTYMELDPDDFSLDEELAAICAPTFVIVEDGSQTVSPAPVTLTARSGARNYNGTTPQTISGFTPSVAGLSFEGVTATGSGTEKGSYPVTFEGVELGETTDTTGNYVVTETVDGELIVAVLVENELTGFVGNTASYEIRVNPDGTTLNGGQPLTLRDSFNAPGVSNQSIYYNTVAVDPADGVLYDYSGSTGTFSIPDGMPVTITYTTRVLASAGEHPEIGITSVVGRTADEGFEPWGTATVSEEHTVGPAESDISGEAGRYTIKIFTYPDGHMEQGLAGAEFRLLDHNQRPVTYRKGERTGEQVTFVTGSDGYATIELTEAEHGVYIHKNTVYYLEMVEAPVADNGDGSFTYYQQDNTLLNFLITDNPEYSAGESGIYTYFNDDVLKVRCYEEHAGINVTMRFTGNYTLTDEQRNEVVFVLERENTLTGLWDEVERHSYAEFTWGSLLFDTGKNGWAARDYGATFHVRLETAGIEGVELSSVCFVGSQSEGGTTTEETNEFLVDPDNRAYSFNLTFTNEYAHHKLTFYAIEEERGDLIDGAQFTTYRALDETQTPVLVYETDESGTTDIAYDDAYEPDTLYYAVQTSTPADYLLPDEPERVYFYFSGNNPLVPSGLPTGETALDLSKSFTTVAVSNASAKAQMPVIVTWGLSGMGTWPQDEVDHVVIQLYRSVDGGPSELVAGKRVELDEDVNFDNEVFRDLALREDGHEISYTLAETIYDASGTDVTDHYAVSDTVSTSGWHVLRNQAATSVMIGKQWRGIDGEPVAAPTGLASVRFDLYRTTRSGEELLAPEAVGADAGDGTSAPWATTEDGYYTREQWLAALEAASATCVRSGLELTADADWARTVPGLQATDASGTPYYYYALEVESSMPENHVDSYGIVSASSAHAEVLSIHNTQTPVTVTVQAPEDATKTYGEGDPSYASDGSATAAEPDFPFVVDVQAEGATATCTAVNAEAGEYAIEVVMPGEEPKTIGFTLDRPFGEDVGTYALTPSGEAMQEGFRVVYRPGALTINRAEVVVAAGQDAEGNPLTKTYGEDDPALATVTGLQFGEAPSAIRYECYREPGEDVDTYDIYVAGDAEQGNYHVTFLNGSLSITRASVTVEPDAGLGKTYGEDDPELTATVIGLSAGDAAGVVEYTITREAGEDVGEYDIVVTGNEAQGNYTVTYRPGTFAIEPAPLTVVVGDAEKTYGEADPAWNIALEGLQGGDAIAEGSPVVEGTTYTYTLTDGKTIAFTLSGGSGTDVGEYDIEVDGEEEQGNYTVSYDLGTLYVYPAQLTVTANDVVRDVSETADPPLTATVSGWQLGDGASVLTRVELAGEVTCLYTLDGQQLLRFSLGRDPGTTEGDYFITPSGATNQGNYEVDYVAGTFSILSVYHIDVRQLTADRVNPTANPSYAYQAEVDLTGTGLTRMTGFDQVSPNVWRRDFTLPGAGGDANLETLSIPIGARLTVRQQPNAAQDGDYETTVALDGDAYETDGELACVIEQVDDYYAIAFTHTRICLPVAAMSGTDQAEAGATAVTPSGFMGIPNGEQAIDDAYVRTLEGAIGYTLPTDKYYGYDHAALYHEAGADDEAERIGSDDVLAVRYVAPEGETARRWQYQTSEGGAFVDMPEDAVLRLYYYPRYICQVDEDPGDARATRKFYTLNEALAFVQDNAAFAQEDDTVAATIELLLADYRMPGSDALTIPEGVAITLTTATTDYEGAAGTTAKISRTAGHTGHLLANDGSLTLDRIELDGNGASVAGADAMVQSAGTLVVGAQASLHGASGVNGGAISMTAGTATISGALYGNTATHGGALYVSGGEVTLDATLGGSAEQANTATSGGGAAFMTGGSVEVVGGTVSHNTAGTGNGGAFYLEGGTLTVSDGTIANNAAANGGMAYATGGDITVSGGTVRDNQATAGNGGAICYTGPGTVVLGGGTVQGNAASNFGGALYQSSGEATISGTIGGTSSGTGVANTAANGAAVYVHDGITHFVDCTIQNNRTTAANGGAVGVDATARLYFSGNSKVNNNKNSANANRNVYLDEDSDEIINVPTAGFGGSAEVRVFVSDEVLATRGEVCCSFGAYVGTANVVKFVDDRGTYNVYKDSNKLHWGKAIKFVVRYVATGLPTGAGQGTKLYPTSGNTYTYYPKQTTYETYDLVTTLYNELFHDTIQTGYVYSCAQVKGATAYANYVTSISWDATAKKWQFNRHEGAPVTNQDELTIYYQNAAYLSITNNDSHDVTIDPLTVMGADVVAAGYGYVTAINNVTQTTLEPIGADTLTIPAGGSVRLLFPGATGAAWSLGGTAAQVGEGESIQYAINGGTQQPLPLQADGSFALSGSLSSSSGVIYEILFGEPTPICKIVDGQGEHPFTSLTSALTFVTNASKATHEAGEQWYQPAGADADVKRATIQMLVDYQQPKTDILTIPEGYDITLTTADPKPDVPAPGVYYYVGEDATHATISRSSGDMGSAVTAPIKDGTQVIVDASTRLSVSELIFDGKALGQGGEGGAINTSNTIVEIADCTFKGYTALRGGAIYTKWGRLTVSDSSFERCRVIANQDKTGGGGMWTTAQVLTVDNCTFADCYGDIQAQGSAVFHNIRYDGAVVHPADSQKFPTGYSKASETYITNCQFDNCTANGSGGTVESDALKVEIRNCSFDGSQTLKSGGNGGAINIYTNDNNSIPTTASVLIEDCSFEDCSAPNGTTNGGAIRTLSPILTVRNSQFRNAFSKQTGGAISMSVAGSRIEIEGCTFENCSADNNSGAIYANATTVTITDSFFTDCSAPSYGGVYQSRNNNGSKVTVTNSGFRNCKSTNAKGGALYVLAKELVVSGSYEYEGEGGTEVFTFQDCSASSDGGAVYHSGTSETLTNCVFEGCSSGTNGGGAYLETTTSFSASGVSVSGCKATNAGGGLYLSPKTATLTDCAFDGNWLTASDGMGGALYLHKETVTLNGGTVDESKAAYGGGIYQKAGTLNLNGTAISSCAAVLGGGGLYHAGIANAYGSIEDCVAKQGGGIYSAAQLTFDNATNGMVIRGCEALTVSLASDGTLTRAQSAVAENQGGGIYHSAGTLRQSSAGTAIVGCTAYDGGGIYQAGGSLTLRAGRIGGVAAATGTAGVAGNDATHFGGGIYHAGGTLAFGGNVANVLVTRNTADKGAGIFVAAGQTMSMDVYGDYHAEVSGNHARVEGGGIAVEAASSRLNFQNYAIVQNNTQGADDELCNVYLDQDTNEVIRNTAWLNASCNIGVYVKTPLMAAHGEPGMPFGTYANANNLNVFHNDRLRYLYGMQGTDSRIVWATFVAKITNAAGDLLYTDQACTVPAVYPKLEGTGATAAFASLSGTFYRDGQPYSGAYQVQMLVQDYAVTGQMVVPSNKTVTLTTASTTADECDFKYGGDPKHPRATITRAATYGSMLQANAGSNLTLTSIILDGGYDPDNGSSLRSDANGGILYITGNNTSATVGDGATLRNSAVPSSMSGGAIRVQSENGSCTIADGARIEGCTAYYGGGVSVKTGTLIMTGGTITGCTASYGGGVRADTTLRMQGGEIVGNTATIQGGGVSTPDNSSSAKVHFSGEVRVTGNLLVTAAAPDGIACNVQLVRDANDVINTTGLDARSQIGIYTTGTYYTKHGVENMPFATRSGANGDSCLYCFVNDVNELCGGKISDADKKVYWVGRPMLEVHKSVASDWSADKNRAFAFSVTLQLNGATDDQLPDYGFSRTGVATFSLKDEATWGDDGVKYLSLPTRLVGTGYTITEQLEGEEEFTTAIEKDGTPYATGTRTISGTLGENVDGSEHSTSVTTVRFANTRVRGDLTLAKAVESRVAADSTDKEFSFVVTLGDQINGTYAVTGNERYEVLRFEGGISETIALRHAEAVTIEDLPKGLPFTVSESIGADKNLFTTRVSSNGASESSLVDDDNRSTTGVVGEASTTGGTGGSRSYYTSRTFHNIRRDVVCKITDRNRNLLAYRDGNELVPAVYFRLEDAFDQINRGGLRTLSDGSASGTLRIEMVVTDYAMERPATLNAGKTMILGTALTGDDDGYPYNGGVDDERGNYSVVSRGYDGESMVATAGTLTVDNVVLDGGGEAGHQATGDGGIIRVEGANRLTINALADADGQLVANLRNSDAGIHDGGAIWLGQGAQLTMGGRIDDCSAWNGGAIYADEGFRSITVDGRIYGCEAVASDLVEDSGYGGAIYAASGTSGITLNASARLDDNVAGRDGGAIWSGATVNVRGARIGGNEAAGNGGGVCLDEAVTFNMTSGSFEDNVSLAGNGGGLVAQGPTSISGGTFSGNRANGPTEGTGRGGAIYYTADAPSSLTIRGNATRFEGNQAAQYGGAVAARGDVVMSAGTMTGNLAPEGGGAVYMETGSFAMRGGSIRTNRSDRGAVYAAPGAELHFSGNAVVFDNTTYPAGSTTRMNVYLDLDSNVVINTTGLGSNASIGVYVADGGGDHDLLYRHGIADRNFATYWGDNPRSAHLEKFSNDRDGELFGFEGELKALGGQEYYVMWPGKNLYVQVSQFDIQLQDDGTPVLDGNGACIPAETFASVVGARFSLTNDLTGEVVWSGASDATGLVTIPWSKIEAAGSNTAVFKENSSYTLVQENTSDACVLPAGSWTVSVGRGNGVAWETNDVDADDVNRTLDVVSPSESVLGKTFVLFNDRQPRITFDPQGGTLFNGGKAESDGAPRTKTEDIDFGRDETSPVVYTIRENDPVRSSKFINWATVRNPGEDDATYTKGDTLTFVRRSDYDDVILYAQWVPVVCKITDRDGTLLYVDGVPAIYATLEAGFDDFNNKKFTYANGKTATARRIAMLVAEYDQQAPVTLNRGKTAILTTASVNDAEFKADDGVTTCVIRRAYDEPASMITNLFNLTLTNITLDGAKEQHGDAAQLATNGGIVAVTGEYASLSINDNATLRNAAVSGNGGAVYAAGNTTVKMVGGHIAGNEAGGDGAGIYLSATAVLNISGNPSFGDGTPGNPANTVHKADYADKVNGGEAAYEGDAVRQDIFTVDADEAPASIVVDGNLTGGSGSIWVWADSALHHKQLLPFAVLGTGVSGGNLMAFRNAVPDDMSENPLDTYLYGTSEGETPGYVYWSGSSGARKVILRKVDRDSRASVAGARFTVYRGSQVAKVDGVELRDLEAAANGVFWVGDLRFGTYYLIETTVPSGYQQLSDEGNWYVLTVDEAGVGYEPVAGDATTIEGSLPPLDARP